MALFKQQHGTVLCGSLMCSHHTNALGCLETMCTMAAFNEVGCISSFPLSLLELEPSVEQCFSAICFSPSFSCKKKKKIGSTLYFSNCLQSAGISTVSSQGTFYRRTTVFIDNAIATGLALLQDRTSGLPPSLEETKVMWGT